jgi:hypothetical protein
MQVKQIFSILKILILTVGTECFGFVWDDAPKNSHGLYRILSNLYILNTKYL